MRISTPGIGAPTVSGFASPDAQEHRALGHAVELLQIDAERAVELEEVGADRFARGIGHPDAAQPERVLQRCIDHEIAEPVEQPVAPPNRPVIEEGRAGALGNPEEIVEQTALHPGGILHADRHLGQNVLEDPRRREQVARPEFAQIGHRGRPGFRARHAEPGAIGLDIGEDMLADPRHWQIGDDLLLVGQPLEFDRRAGGRDQVVEAEHDPLGPPGGARRIQDDRGVGAAEAGNFGGEETRLLPREAAPLLLHPVIGMEVGLVVMAQAPRVAKDHGFEQRAALLDQDQLVDLLLVLDDGETHLGVVEDIGHLIGDRVLVDRHGHAAQGLRRGDRPVEPRAVVADDRQLVAAREPERLKAARERLDLGGNLRPAPALPDAVILLAHRRPLRAQAGMLEQHFRKRIERRCRRRGCSRRKVRHNGSLARHPASFPSAATRSPPARPSAAVGSGRRSEWSSCSTARGTRSIVGSNYRLAWCGRT